MHDNGARCRDGGGVVVLIIFASLYFATKRDTNDDDDDDDDDAHSLRGRIANSEKKFTETRCNWLLRHKTRDTQRG